MPTKNVSGKERKVIISHMCPCARTCATSLLPKRKKSPKLFVQACMVEHVTLCRDKINFFFFFGVPLSLRHAVQPVTSTLGSSGPSTSSVLRTCHATLCQASGAQRHHPQAHNSNNVQSEPFDLQIVLASHLLSSCA